MFHSTGTTTPGDVEYYTATLIATSKQPQITETPDSSETTPRDGKITTAILNESESHVLIFYIAIVKIQYGYIILSLFVK